MTMTVIVFYELPGDRKTLPASSAYSIPHSVFRTFPPPAFAGLRLSMFLPVLLLPLEVHHIPHGGLSEHASVYHHECSRPFITSMTTVCEHAFGWTVASVRTSLTGSRPFDKDGCRHHCHSTSSSRRYLWLQSSVSVSVERVEPILGFVRDFDASIFPLPLPWGFTRP